MPPKKKKNNKKKKRTPENRGSCTLRIILAEFPGKGEEFFFDKKIVRWHFNLNNGHSVKAIIAYTEDCQFRTSIVKSSSP